MLKIAPFGPVASVVDNAKFSDLRVLLIIRPDMVMIPPKNQLAVWV